MKISNSRRLDKLVEFIKQLSEDQQEELYAILKGTTLRNLSFLNVLKLRGTISFWCPKSVRKGLNMRFFMKEVWLKMLI